MNFSPHLLFIALMLTISAVFADEDLDQEVQGTSLLQKGAPAADFTCVDITGKQRTLSNLKGKVVVLYFFSSSNLSSVTDLENLENEIFKKLRDKEAFQMLAIGRDYQREELVKLGGERKLTLPLVADPQRVIYDRYFTKFVPRTVVVRADGTIAYQTSGSNYEKILELQRVLAQELKFKAP